MTKIFLTSARINHFKKLGQIQAMSSHSLRADGASIRRLRPGAVKGAGLHWSSRVDDPGVSKDDVVAMRDVEAAFKGNNKRHGIGENQNGGLGIHLMLNVTAAWLKEAGGIHDANNKRVQDLFREGMAFGEATFGTNSLYAARIDLDELGAGVVDLFLTPARYDGRTKKNPKLKIMTSTVLTELRLKHGERMSYSALQTEWANWCQLRLSPDFQRGRRKAETRAEHLEVEEYKEARKIAQADIDQTLAEAHITAEEIIREAEHDAIESAHSDYALHLLAMIDIDKEQNRLALEQAEIADKRLKVDAELILIERKHQILERELDEVGILKKTFMAWIEKLKSLVGFLGDLRLSVEERDVVKSAGSLAKQAEHQADQLMPNPQFTASGTPPIG